MKELDLLLGEWLERSWPLADAEQRRSFQWLLEQSDTDLAAWLIGGARPPHTGHAAIIDEIVRSRD